MEGEFVRVKTKAAEGRAFAPQIRAFAKKVAITETRYAEESEPERAIVHRSGVAI
jgi:hypothetical protein